MNRELFKTVFKTFGGGIENIECHFEVQTFFQKKIDFSNFFSDFLFFFQKNVIFDVKNGILLHFQM